MNLISVFFAAALHLVSPQPSDTEAQSIYTGPAACNIVETTWKTEYQDSQIKIESSVFLHLNESKGIRHQRIIFRYTNLTSGKIKLSFSRKMIYNGVCYGCEKNDTRFSLELNAQESKEFSPENKDKTFYLFSKDLTNTITKTLDSFELTAVETTKL